MAWTEEARKKAAEARKAAALKNRLAKAKTVFMADRKRNYAKTQRRDIDTNKFTGMGATNSYSPVTDSRMSKKREKADKILDYIDARASAATDKNSAVERMAPKRAKNGTYTVDNKIVSETLSVFGTTPAKQTREQLTQVAANLAGVQTSGRVATAHRLKVNEVQAVHSLTALARTMPVANVRKPKGSVAPKVARVKEPSATKERIASIQAKVAGKKISWDDIPED